jgi:hypothetical protein
MVNSGLPLMKTVPHGIQMTPQLTRVMVCQRPPLYRQQTLSVQVPFHSKCNNMRLNGSSYSIDRYNKERSPRISAGAYFISELADKPGSVLDNHSSRPMIAHWLKQPTRSQRGPRHKGTYLVLLRVEFTLPSTVASDAVRSYRTLSPLPSVNTWRSPLCCTCRRLTPPRRYLAPCPVEPGLSSPLKHINMNRAAIAWPTRPRL